MLNQTDLAVPAEFDQPTELRRTVNEKWALFVGMGLLMVGSGLLHSVVGLRSALEGFSTTTTGVVMSSYYLGFLIGSKQAPRFVANVGHIRTFAALAAITSSSALVHLLVVHPGVWITGRLATGFGLAGLFVVAESWLNSDITNSSRGSVLSIYLVVANGGMAAGQLLLNIGDPATARLFLIVSILFSLSLVPTSLSATSSPQLFQPKKVSLASVYAAAPLGVVGSLVAGAAAGAVFGAGVIYTQLAGFTLAQTSIFMMLIILGGAVLQWPIGALSDRMDRRKMIAITAFFSAGVCMLGIVFPSGAMLYVLAVAMGGFIFPLYSLANAHANDFMAPEDVVGAGSQLIFVNGIGSVAGPILVTAVMAKVGPSGYFWYLAWVHIAIAAYAMYRMAKRAPIAPEDQSTYASYPAESSVLVATLDPQAWDEDDQPRFDTEELPAVEIN